MTKKALERGNEITSEIKMLEDKVKSIKRGDFRMDSAYDCGKGSYKIDNKFLADLSEENDQSNIEKINFYIAELQKEFKTL